MINLHKKSDAATGVIRRPITEVRCDILPFKPGLAYCPPARGHWTIAHTPMLIPGSYMIYLCASACMRGVVLSALEYEGMDRFSMVILNDRDIYEGNLEQVMIDGISEIIDRLPQHPPIVMPFTSCIHHFLACDNVYIYQVLRGKYPDIDFVECYMIPTIRKGRITPEEQMQINLYDALERQDHLDEKSVNILGCNFPSDPDNDYIRMLTDAGYTVRDLPETRTYEEYKDMARSCANICPYPVAGFAAKKLEKRLGQKAYSLPVTYNYKEIRQELTDLADYFHLTLPDLDDLQSQADRALAQAKAVIGDTPIAIDHEVVPNFCSLARLLVEHGFKVEEIYADAVLPADEENLKWLQKNAPHIVFCSVGNYACRLEDRDEAQRNNGHFLAIGQKAAYFTGSKHMVNLIENGGLWGYHAVFRLAQLMNEAYLNESDVPSIIQVKAWGCYEAVHGNQKDYTGRGSDKSLIDKRTPVNEKTETAVYKSQETQRSDTGTAEISCAGDEDKKTKAERMKQVYNETCTYSADLYGVNSALYELGGLLVMHDASGCNSTYNTHDEPRWWGTDSMVYVSGLDESDAILGNDDRLIDEIVDVAQREHPKFIALTRSVLPAYMGTDLKGIARIIEKRTGIPTFGFVTNGMDTYIKGASMAYRAIAERFCKAKSTEERTAADLLKCKSPTETKAQIERLSENSSLRGDTAGTVEDKKPSLNLIGVTPLDFSVNGNVEALKQAVKDMGCTLQSCWSVGCSLKDIVSAPDGDVSLVVSADGLSAAKYLYEAFGVPYVIGIPCGGKASDRLKELLYEAARTGKCRRLFSENMNSFAGDDESDEPDKACEVKAEQECKVFEKKDKKVLIIGEAVHCASIRFLLEHEYSYTDVNVLCPLELDAGALRDTDIHETAEEKIEQAVNASDIVIADPVYRRIADSHVIFLDDPHDAYSGRMYHDIGIKFVGKDVMLFRKGRFKGP